VQLNACYDGLLNEALREKVFWKDGDKMFSSGRMELIVDRANGSDPRDLESDRYFKLHRA